MSPAPSTAGVAVSHTPFGPGKLASARWLSTRLPRRPPASAAALPSVLEDPPGRALLAYHPPEQYDRGPAGWANEEILFYGADGRWRILRMEELGLPASAWFPDTYGAGGLSSDGRWWAAPSGSGAVVVDLARGALVSTDLPDRYTPTPVWVPGENAFVTFQRQGPAVVDYRVSIPSGEITRTPFHSWRVGFDPAGTPLTLRRQRDGTTGLYAWQTGQLRFRAAVPDELLHRTEAHAVRVHASTSRIAKHVVDTNQERVVDTATGTLEAVLTLSERGDAGLVGWLDEQTLLFRASGGLYAWRPETRQIRRVFDVASPATPYWSVAVAGVQ